MYYSNNGVPTIIPLQSVVESLQSTVSNLQNNSYSNNNKPYVIGCYQGNGASSRTMSLGFTPISVIVMQYGINVGTSTIIAGGIAITGSPSATYNNYTVLSVTSNGFNCYYNANTDVYTNYNDTYYNYIAFK